jgi:YebC/PmpR family DNA-binding regulatory protein
MSGHSHWAKIKRAKGSNDAKRGLVWSKIARRITVAAKTGGGKPADNLSLRYVIDEARAANMPNDTIDRAVKKGTGELGAAVYETVLYEGYGPAGVAFLVDCLTDKRQRTAPELRTLFDKHGGQMAGANSVAWMFQQKGVFVIASDAAEEDSLMELALEAGAEDVSHHEDIFEIVCETAAFQKVKAALEASKIPLISAKIAMIPTTQVPVGADKAAKVIGLLEALEEHEDVQNVYANFDIPDEVLAQVSK